MANCLKEGIKYEKQIYNIVKRCITPFNTFFNTQEISDLGRSSIANDLICSWNDTDIPIEIKKSKSPDWVQCILKYNMDEKIWKPTFKRQEHECVIDIFESILKSTELFNGKIPPFVNNKITHKDWVQIKKETGDFKDMYIPCENDTINNLYYSKGCKYIQISGKGLYCLKDDPCDFDVPKFDCEQQMRIRTKIHTRKDAHGFCSLSVTIACQPVKIKNLKESLYSLDDVKKLPQNLHF